MLVRENIRQQGVEPDLDGSDPRETRHEYDESGRLTAVILPAVEHPDTQQLVHPRYEYEYDAFGNQKIIRDNVTQDPASGDIDDSNARQTTFTYDASGRQLTRTLPEGEQERFEYNDLGQRTLHVSFEGRVTEFQYDNSPGAGGQLAEKRFFGDEAAYDDGNGTPAQTISYTYDAFGRVVEIVDSDHGTWTTTYDADGQVIEEGSPQGTVGYEYNALGNLTATFTANTKTEYGYDDLGRLETVTMAERQGQALPTPEITTYTYDLVGNLDTVLHSNDLLSDYQYDELNRLTLLTHHGPDDGGARPLLASFDYTLNLDGNRASVEQVFTADFAGEPTDLVTTIEWEYDALNRLVQETYTTNYDTSLDYVTTYTFDLVGNRLEMATTYDDGGQPATDTTTYTYDNNDRLLTETLDHTNSAEDRHTVYTYDATEQATKTIHEGLDDTGTLLNHTEYGYNLQGRMNEVNIDSNGDSTFDTVETYTYNPTGIRVEKAVTEGGQTTVHEYVIDAHNHTGHAQVLEEWVDQVLERTFTIGHTVSSQHDLTNGTLTLLVDGHNSTMALLDDGAALIQRFAYDAYGNVLVGLGLTSAADALTTHLYAGEQFDSRTGLSYNRARYYNPSTGRFNRRDPWDGNHNDPQTLHKYLYAHANPVMGTDPTGLFTLIGMAGAAGIRSYLTGVYLSVHHAAHSAVFGAMSGMSGWDVVHNFMMDQMFGPFGERFHRDPPFDIYTGDPMDHVLYAGPSTGTHSAARVARGKKLLALKNVPNAINDIKFLVRVGKQARLEAGSRTATTTHAALGTRVHTKARNLIRSSQRSGMHAEVSYKNGAEVDYGTSGSTRFDAVIGPRDNPVAVADYKPRHSRGISLAREEAMRGALPRSARDIPIIIMYY